MCGANAFHCCASLVRTITQVPPRVFRTQISKLHECRYWWILYHVYCVFKLVLISGASCALVHVFTPGIKHVGQGKKGGCARATSGQRWQQWLEFKLEIPARWAGNRSSTLAD